MYKVVNKKFKNWDEFQNGEALVCLEDTYGGQSVIAEDDHCYVLYNGSDNKSFKIVKHWPNEAVWALVNYLMGTLLEKNNE